MIFGYHEITKDKNQNYLSITFDSASGYLCISQYNESGSYNERVSLSPLQVKALQKFLHDNGLHYPRRRAEKSVKRSKPARGQRKS